MQRAFVVSCLALVSCGSPRSRWPTDIVSTGRSRTLRPASEIRALVSEIAEQQKVPELLVLAVIQVESGFRVDARSSAGARGLMQLMPKTAAGLAKRLGYDEYDILDPRFNVEAGTAYLRYLLKMFRGNEALALAAYHTGPVRIRRWQRRGRPLPAYSRRYVRAVMRARDRFVDEGPSTESIDKMIAESILESDRKALREVLSERLGQAQDDDTSSGTLNSPSIATEPSRKAAR